MTLFWLCIVCIICFVIGIVGAIYHYNRVKSWTVMPTTEEYMECLMIGWSSWMIVAIAGGGTFFTLIPLILSVIK